MTPEVLRDLGPFDSVLDVGGNVGDFAELCRALWPEARITSFEPIGQLADRNHGRAGGRWLVEPLAISSHDGPASIAVCTNQHSASTMQGPGSTRRQRFGITDRFEHLPVTATRLDSYTARIHERAFGRLLVKVDVEGHEGHVLAGATETLRRADVAIVEVQQDPNIFLGSPTPSQVDQALVACGLTFAGVLSSLAEPRGNVVQFDGLWRRGMRLQQPA